MRARLAPPCHARFGLRRPSINAFACRSYSVVDMALMESTFRHKRSSAAAQENEGSWARCVARRPLGRRSRLVAEHPCRKHSRTATVSSPSASKPPALLGRLCPPRPLRARYQAFHVCCYADLLVFWTAQNMRTTAGRIAALPCTQPSPDQEFLPSPSDTISNFAKHPEDKPSRLHDVEQGGTPRSQLDPHIYNFALNQC